MVPSVPCVSGMQGLAKLRAAKQHYLDTGSVEIQSDIWIWIAGDLRSVCVEGQ